MNVVNAIEGILSTENTIRQQSEHQLEEYKKTEEYSLILLKIGREHTNEGVQMLSYVLLRKHFTSDLWKSLTPNTKQAIQKELLSVISVIKNKKILSMVLHAISELVTAMDDIDEKWSECTQYASSCLASEDLFVKELGFRILSRTIVIISDDLMANPDAILAHFANAFNSSLTKQSLSYIDSALECYSHLVCYVTSKEVAHFSLLIPSILKCIMAAHLIKDEEGLKGMLDSIIDISDSEPKFLIPNFFDLCDLCCTIAVGDYFDDWSVPQIALELLVNIMERYKEKVGSNGEKLRVISECLFKIMVEVDKDIPESWLSPKEGFKEEDDEEDGLKFGETTLSRLCGVAEESIFMPILMSQCQLLISHDDWRHKAAALSAISQIGEFIAANIGLSSILGLICEHAKHQNPRIRYAAIHAIGQIAEDVEEFSDGFQKQVMPLMKQVLLDPIPRVQSQACGALANLLDNLSEHDLKSYINDFLPLLISLVKDGISITKENSIRCITSFGESCAKKFEEHLNEIMSLFIPWLSQAASKEYKELRGLLIECIAVIAESVGKDVFKPYLERFVKELITIQENQVEKEDVLRTYLLGAWEKLCTCESTDILPYLDIIMPSIIKLAESVPGMTVSGASSHQEDVQTMLKEIKGEKQKIIHVTSHDIEEKLAALKMIETFLKELRGGFAKYLEQVTKLLLDVVNYTANENIRKTAADCLALVVPAAEEAHASQEGMLMLCNACIEVLLKSMKTEYEPDVIMHQCSALKSLIMKGMNPQSIVIIFQNLVAAINQSNKRKVDNTNAKNESDEEVEEELVKQDNEMEDDLQITISDVIGQFFKVNPDESMPIFGLLYPSLIIDFLKPEATPKQQLFAIYIIVDFVEFLGPTRIHNEPYEQMIEQLLKYIDSTDPAIIQACYYGLGAATMTAGDIFAKYSERIGETLLKGMKLIIKKPKKIFGAARDNAISSFGKMLKHKCKILNLPMVYEWAAYLPLKYDKEEGVLQADFFCDLCINQQLPIIKELLPIIFKVVIKITDEKIRPKFKVLLKCLEAESIKQQAMEAYSLLTDTEKATIEELLKSK